jgi:hypothetical protein
MAIQTASMKNSLATAYKNAALYGALYTTVPGAAAGTEVTGGTYARISLASLWGTVTNGVVTAVATFNVPAGQTVAGAGLHDAATAGNYLDGGSIGTPQPFSQAGQYACTFTFTES